MTHAHGLKFDPTKDNKTEKNIEVNLKVVDPDQALMKTTIYDIIHKAMAREEAVDGAGLDTPKCVRAANFNVAVRSNNDEERLKMMQELNSKYELSNELLFNGIHDDLGLQKAPGKKVPDFLTVKKA